MQFPIHVGLHRSRIFGGLFLLAGGLALLGIGFSPWPVLWRLLLALPLVFLLWRAWTDLEPPGECLLINDHGQLELLQGGAGRSVVMVGSPYVHRWLTAFSVVDPSGKRYRLVVTVDSTSPEDFRRLRVFLSGEVRVSAGRGADV